MKKNNNKILAKRKRKIKKRPKRKQWENQLTPMFSASNIHYEMDGRHKGMCEVARPLSCNLKGGYHGCTPHITSQIRKNDG